MIHKQHWIIALALSTISTTSPCLGGDLPFGDPQVIATSPPLFQNPRVAPADFDLDGDIDCVVFGAESVYLENGGGAFPDYTAVANPGYVDPRVVVDFDGDGRDDVLGYSNSSLRIVRYDSTGPDLFVAEILLPGISYTARVHAGDIDSDGDMDLLVDNSSSLGWYENTSLDPPAFSYHAIPESHAFSRLDIGDYDGDGDQDICGLTTGGDIVLFRNDGTSLAFVESTIGTIPPGSGSQFAVNAFVTEDLDGDGDLDLATGALQWWLNDGLNPPTFTESIYTIPDVLGASNLRSADFDSDGDPDLLARYLFTTAGGYDEWRTGWFENLGTNPPTYALHLIPGAGDWYSNFFIVDMDGNGSLDVLNGSVNARVWTNDGASPPMFSSTELVSSPSEDSRLVQLDGGGEWELLYRFGDQMFWMPLAGSDPSSYVAEPIDEIEWFYDWIADVDGDGFRDRLLVSGTDLVVRPNLGVTPPAFGPPEVLASSVPAGSVLAIDFDFDGDRDIFIRNSGLIEAFLNDGGSPPAFTRYTALTVTEGTLNEVRFADIDGDGDRDLVTQRQYALGSIRWHENDGSAMPVFDDGEIINTSYEQTAWPVRAFDVDLDGDQDVISATGWFRNQGGDPLTFVPLYGSLYVSYSSSLVDMDGDGDRDVVNFDSWLENRIPQGESHVSWPLPHSTEQVFDVDLDGLPDLISLVEADGPFLDLALLRNEGFVLDVPADEYRDSITEAFDIAGAGADILVVPDATLGEPEIAWPTGATLRSRRAFVQPGNGDYTLADSALLAAAEGDPVTLGGIVRLPAFASAVIEGESITSMGTVRLEPYSLLEFRGPAGISFYDGLFLESSATLYSTDPLSLLGQTSLYTGAEVISGVGIEIEGPVELWGGQFTAETVTLGGPLEGYGTIHGDLINEFDVLIQADVVVTGNYVNESVTTIQNGLLTVLGGMSGNGSIVVAPGPATGVFVAQGVTATATTFVDIGPGAVFSIGGDAEFGFTDPANVDLSEAELRLTGVGGQTLELVSTDLGPSLNGYGRDMPGQFPVGTLRIGPTSTTVTLVDAVDNDGLGQAVPEAIYATQVIVEPGATLANAVGVIYYQELELLGTVSHPENLISATGTPFRRADCNDDGSENIGDAIRMLDTLFAATPMSACPRSCDANGDDQFDIGDAIALLGWLFSNAPDLPEPFLECGAGPASVTLPCEDFSSCSTSP